VIHYFAAKLLFLSVPLSFSSICDKGCFISLWILCALLAWYTVLYCGTVLLIFKFLYEIKLILSGHLDLGGQKDGV
jgi:hypothetical protein